MLFFSCGKRKVERSGNQVFDPSELKDYEEKVLKNGDVDAYESLQTFYMDRPAEEFLGFALLMANEYNYPKANFDIFEIIIAREGCSVDYNLNCLSEETRKEALVYFRKAIMDGHKVSSELLIEYYDRDKLFPIEELFLDDSLMTKAKQNILFKTN